MNILKSQLTDDSKVKQLIDNSINRIFSEKFHEKFTNFKENCKLTHYQTRRDFFLKMKYLVFNKNFLYDFRDEAKIQELAKNLSIPLFFPDNDKENFLEVPNPELAPEKFPPAEMTKFIKKNKLGEKEQYKVLAGKDEISKFFDEKKEIFSEKKNERDLYFKPTPQTIALKEKTFEYQRRYGLKDREKSFREDYIKETMKYIRFSRTMQNYIFNNVKTDLNDFFFENQKATYKDIALEFLADMKVKEKITKEPIKEADLKSLQEKIDVAKEINKEMKAEYDGERFDLQMTGNLKYNNFKKLNEKNIMEQVLNFIANEPELKTLFDPLVTQVNCKYGDSLRDKYLKLFLKIYEKHSEELLKRELNEFKSAAPLLTRNGQTPFLFENKDSYMDYFDDHIHRSVGIDFHKLIMDDVLYIFSYFVLIELERKLNSFSTAALNCEKFCTPPALNDKIPNYTKRLKEYERSIIRIYKNHGLIFENFEEMQETIDFMNSMCFNMGGIHSLTRDKIKFPHTRLYKNYQEKINEKYQDYEGFMQEFVSKYEFQKDLQTKIKKLELEKTEKFFILDNNNDYDLSSHNLQSLVKEGDSKIFEKLALNQISPLEQKVSKIGVIDYLRKLEGLTARGINGKYNVFSNFFIKLFSFLFGKSFLVMNMIYLKRCKIYRIILGLEIKDNQQKNG